MLEQIALIFNVYTNHRLVIASFVCYALLAPSITRADNVSISDIKKHTVRDHEASRIAKGRMLLEIEVTKDEQNEREQLLRRKSNSALPQEIREGLARRESRLSEECHRNERREYNFDMQVKRQRIEIQDLRDLQAMVAAGNLPGDKMSLANAN